MRTQTCRMALDQVEQRFRAAMRDVIANGGKIARGRFGVRVAASDVGGEFVHDGPCCALGAWALVDQPPPGWSAEEYEDDEFYTIDPETDTEQATRNAALHVFGWTRDEHGAFMMAFDGCASDSDRKRYPEIVSLAELLARDFTRPSVMP